MSEPGRHFAILIGSSQFAADSGLKPLRCPENDVDGIGELLTSPEFGLFAADHLHLFKNRPHHEIKLEVNRVFRKAEPQDLILFYYSGHGVLDNRQHLHLTTLDSMEELIEATSIPTNWVRQLIDNHRCKRIVMILDCCYSGAAKNDYRAKGSLDGQIKLLSKGIYTLTASTEFEIAEERDDYGLLTKHILEGVRLGKAASNPDGLISVNSLFQYVAQTVPKHGGQTPTCEGLDEQGGELYVARAAAVYSRERLLAFRKLINQLDGDEIDEEICDQARRVLSENQPKRDKRLFELLSQLHETQLKPGRFSSLWMREAGMIQPSPSMPPQQSDTAREHLPAPKPQSPPRQSPKPEAPKFITDDLNGIKLEMIYVPGGTFKMGAPKSKEGSTEQERPQHDVTVPALYVGKFQITLAQWKAVMGGHPAHLKRDDLPIETISWNEAKEFCQKLAQMTKRDYRLPSESEWEYACRAGTTTAFAFGDSLSSEQANFDGNYPYGGAPKALYREKTTPIGSFEPNAWGIGDMHGNVWEWCEDVWHSDYKGAPLDGSAWLKGGNQNSRVVRGGSWGLIGYRCRSASRRSFAPTSRLNAIGLRVLVSARTS